MNSREKDHCVLLESGMAMPSTPPVELASLSVIVPTYNCPHLDRCLAALRQSTYPQFEIIVVDDASDRALGADLSGIRVLRLETRSGPAAARNSGARVATGTVLVFVDSDVMVRPATLERLARPFNQKEDIDAVFGSYDDAPAEKNFFSQYKNLFHHFTHQHSNSQSASFWAGCGAVRREAFERVGGFDQIRYRRPMIEDVELGSRLHANGYRIRLDKQLQVNHLKRWTFLGLLHSDIFCRAVPWSRHIREKRVLFDDLNFRWNARLSALLVGLLCATLACSGYLPWPQVLGGLAALAGSFVLLNFELTRFFMRKHGLGFAAAALGMQMLYYLYGSVVLLWILALGLTRRR